MITTIGGAHGDIEGRMILADNNPLIRSSTPLKTWVQLAVHAVQSDPPHRHQYRIQRRVRQGVKHCLFQSKGAYSWISTVATSLDLRLLEHQDLQLGHHRWLSPVTMVLPMVAQPGVVRYLPRIIHLLRGIIIMEMTALLPSRPRRSQPDLSSVLVAQIDLAIHDLQS